MKIIFKKSSTMTLKMYLHQREEVVPKNKNERKNESGRRIRGIEDVKTSCSICFSKTKWTTFRRANHRSHRHRSSSFRLCFQVRNAIWCTYLRSPRVRPYRRCMPSTCTCCPLQIFSRAALSSPLFASL